MWVENSEFGSGAVLEFVLRVLVVLGRCAGACLRAVVEQRGYGGGIFS